MGSKSLRKGLQILKLLHQSPGGLTARELHQGIGSSLRSVYLYLEVLREEGYVAAEPGTGRWILSYPHPGEAEPASLSSQLLARFRSATRKLYQRTGQRAYLSVLRPWGMAMEASYGRKGQRVKVRQTQGETFQHHAHASAAGRAILAHMSPRAQQAHLGRYPLQAFTPRTLTTTEALLARLEEVRRTGFSRARGELNPRICGLAAPLFDHRNQVTAAVSLSLPNASHCVLEGSPEATPRPERLCDRCLNLQPLMRKVLTEEGLWQSLAT